MDGKSSGVGCLTIFGIVFVCAKLFGVIDWSWWWVLAPFWGQIVIALLVFGVAAILNMKGAL